MFKSLIHLNPLFAVPTIVPVPALNEVQSRLESKLVDLQELHSNHQAELIQIQREINNLTSSNAQMEIDMQNTKERYTYFQELKTFVENLVEFLDVKVRNYKKFIIYNI